MRAVVLSGPGPVENLELTELPVPGVKPGWVRIAVKVFGLNEAGGVIDDPSDSGLRRGQQVVAMMGDMGRTYDGGYAQVTVVPTSQVVPFESDLPWTTLAAVGETLQTAYGSLTTGLDLRAGQTLLIRGGTSGVGLAAAGIAKDLGATVLATTRQPERADFLAAHGVDHPIVDKGEVAAQVRRIVPDGVDAALELVGTPTLPDTLKGDEGARHRLLHRDAVEPVDRGAVLPDRVPADRGPADGVLR